VNARLRGLVLLTTGAALVAASAAAAHAAPAATSGVQTVHACNQKVSPGQYTCFAERRSDIKFKTKAQITPLITPSGYSPTSLQSAYALPSATAGAGQRVYIVDAYDDPNAESDLATYRAQYGLPACTTANGCFQKLNQSGTTSPMPTPNSGWAGEISLDLDMVSAICPNCAITLIEANNNNYNSLFPAVKKAADLGGKFVSLSWGGPENGSEPSYDAAYFRSSGVVYTASTGDDAYQYGVIYPATSVDTVAVGGTSLRTAANARGWTETVWKTSSSEGTGSGCSSDEAKPSWQSVIATSVCSQRADSDVAAVADPATGVAVYQTYGGGGWTVYGGTSAAAPIIASVYALAGTPGSTDKPASVPYAHTGNLNDVTSGNNGSCAPSLLCTAAAGWDGPTGLGTPNGTAAFGGSGGGGGGTNTVTVTNPGAQTGTVGVAQSLQIQASDSGGLALSYSATGLPPGVSINASTGLISGTPTTAGAFTSTVTAQDSTGASGATTFGWTIGSSGSSCSGQQLGNPGFESGSASWTASSGVINTDGVYAHSGSGYAWLDGYGRTHTDTLSQTVTIPAGCSASLSYYLWISSSESTSRAYDTLKVSVNGTTVQSFSNVNKGSTYALRSVNVSAFAGRTVTITWTGSENYTRATSFFIDDTALTLS
jgi:hypothetical protein